MKNTSVGFFITEEFFNAVMFLRLASISSSRGRVASRLEFFIIRTGFMPKQS